MIGSRFLDLFPGRKPVIAMAHVPPLPGTPLYDEDRGVDGLVESVRADLRILLDAGVDAIMFCNEGDRPYSFHAGYDGVAVMTRVVTELRPTDRPFGVDYHRDDRAALAMGVATGASFMREVATGAYESDMGIWSTDAAALLRERRRLGSDIAILMNVTPEFASPLGSRTIGQRARSAAVSSLPDAILISGPMAGAEPDIEELREARAAVDVSIPVLVNTGTKARNVASFLEVADGCIVGSDLKVDGGTWNPVDPARVRAFMAAARG
ncbi:MAG: BtpA/SgcQ family protein [Chloroflexi bacterium]|nr:BtpA/SgcQ family protein [Chloroflexota bacterium]